MLVSNSNFLLEKNSWPKNPYSLDYKKYWRKEKIACIEGYWSGGKWMPGNLYFFVNHWKIELSENKNSKNKIIARPFLRDLEWERAYIYTEARGFSRFEKDKKFHCIEEYKDDLLFFNHETGKIIYPNSSIPESGVSEMKFQPVREYLRKNHGEDLGKPLYENQASNVIDIESRGTGKSFYMASLIAHNFLFDGVLSYDELINKPTSETLIGAIDSFYSKGLIKKVILGLDNLDGGIMFNKTYFPAPFSKEFSGSWESGKTIIAEYDIKEGGQWITKGTKSKINHRTFKDNPLAGNGTRPGLSTLEEIGFFNNLIPTLGALKECTANGSIKFGTIWMSGTGGDMVGGSTEAAMEVFYHPKSYQCLVFNDEWEERGDCGLFVPAYMGLNEYKDSEGNTDKEAALQYLLKEREKAALSNDKSPLNDELQNRPIKPSEAFLVTTGNVFPISDLKDHLGWLEASKDADVLGTKGELVVDHNGEVQFKPDLENKLRQADYPVKTGAEEGCVVCWELPKQDSIYGLHVLGTDPYAQDKSSNSVSLGAVYVIKRAMVGHDNHDKVVAEYVGRPSTVDGFNEIVLRLTKFYKGINLYENNIPNLKTYFERKNALHLLAYSPTILKSNSSSTVARIYGQHMSRTKTPNGWVGVKPDLEIYTRDWLSSKVGDKLQLQYIYSKPLIKELIAYNDTGNFDRVIALMLAYAQSLQMFRIKEDIQVKKKIDPWFTRKHNTIA